ncbi:MAG TPA: hypothetical protein VN957_27230 [Chthoniobacterales bacterium]|nr:hypothetical protein [Chthoniobacterales bacterium]
MAAFIAILFHPKRSLGNVEVLGLSVRVLIITANPDISDALTFARHETAFCVRKGPRELLAFVNNFGKGVYSDTFTTTI